MGVEVASRKWLAWLVIAIAIAVAGALAFRLEVVRDYHVPGGSGEQYYKLAETLRARGRFAYAPRPEPLAYTRLPGYPIFLAYVARAAPAGTLEHHLLRATRGNAFLDVGTALLVLLMLRSIGAHVVTCLLGFAAVVACPLLLYLSTFALPESLATFLTTAAIFFVVRARRGRPLVFAGLAGLACGLGQLVRPDMLALGPAVAVALLWTPGSWRRRLAAVGVCGVVAAGTFAPWPIRNLIQFRKPHPLGVEWVTQKGNARPIGMMRWMQTWATGGIHQLYTPFIVERERPYDMDHKDLILPQMYDTPAERQRVLDKLIEAYNKTRLSPDVDAGFAQLARERAHRRPRRTWFWLPLRRLVKMWKPMPADELPVKSEMLSLPDRRAQYDEWGGRALLLALLGALALLVRGSDGRRFVTVAALATVVRSALFVYAHPMPTQRYLAEILPVWMALAACGAASIVEGPLHLARRLLARRRRD